MREDQPPRRTRFGWGGSLRYPRSAWRIRLVAYGARLESVLGASPRGFESPILRRSEGPVTCRYAGGGPFVVGASEAARPRWVAVLVAVRRASKASGARLGSENGRHLPRPD